MKTVALADVCQITMGQAPKGDTYNDQGVGLPLVAGAGDFGVLYPEPKKHTSATGVRTSEPGDVVIGIRASIGDKVLSDGVYCLGRGVAGLRAGPHLDDRYLWNWVSHTAPKLAAKGRGATFLQVNKKDVAEMEIPLPPIEEQRRIAAVLDAADALRAKRRQSLTKLDTLTQAIFIDMFGDPLETRGSSVLAEIVEFVGGGTPSKSTPEFYSGEICWATSKDMKGRFLDDTVDHVTEEAVASSATKIVPAGSVLVVVKSKILAHTLPVAIARVPTCFGQDLKGLLAHGKLSPEFVAGSLRVAERWLLRQARGVNTEGLTLEQLRRTPVPDASPGDVDRFTQLARAAENQRFAAERSLSASDVLFASLQQRAFRGDL